MYIATIGITQESASHTLTTTAADVFVFNAVSAFDDVAISEELIDS
jgi:hypothetical protein